jgi:NADH:ubiquinone oxidoreductase subunit H
MAEYAAMVVVTAVATTLYLGGWYFPWVGRLELAGYHNLLCRISLIVFLAKAGLLLLFVLLAALDLAALPLRSVDGPWLEVDVAGRH